MKKKSEELEQAQERLMEFLGHWPKTKTETGLPDEKIISNNEWFWLWRTEEFFGWHAVDRITTWLIFKLIDALSADIPTGRQKWPKVDRNASQKGVDQFCR